MSLTVNPVLCRAGVMDNYAYIITDDSTGICAVVDASEAAPIIDFCERYDLTPSYILTTHHHFDHIGGNEELKAKYGLQIVGPLAEKNLIPLMDIGLQEGDIFKLGKSEAEVIAAPGHTIGHILYYFREDKILFTGDVLFNLCVGGIFEGTPEEMWHSLQKIKALPDDVMFYPGHEYTMHSLAGLNADFEDMGSAMKEYYDIAVSRLENNQPVAPISLGLEKKCNPYLRISNLKDF